MEIGLGVLGWPPEVFWRATPLEMAAALDGYREKMGVPGAGRAAFGARDVRALRAMMADADA